MYVKVLGIENLSEDQQQYLGQLWLRAMYSMGLQMDGVQIKFENEEGSK